MTLDTIADTIAAIGRLRDDSSRLLPALQKHVQATAGKNPEEHCLLHRLLVALNDFHRTVGVIVI
jgi:hypothetical protein